MPRHRTAERKFAAHVFERECRYDRALVVIAPGVVAAIGSSVLSGPGVRSR